MGIWNTGLYGNDYTCDIRDDYVHLLRNKTPPEEASRTLIYRENPDKAHKDDAALFWFSLADTQWNYGVLEAEIRERALYFCKLATGIIWGWENESDQENWLKTIQSLEDKLRSPQPPRKPIRSFRSYICPWKMGDVFAYRLHKQYSLNLGMFGKFIVFRKISELRCYPEHINPVILVFQRVWDELPSLEEVRNTQLLPSFATPQLKHSNPRVYAAYRDRFYYNFTTTSKQQIPSDQLVLLGRWDDEAIRPRGSIGFSECMPLGWEGTKVNNKIEKTLLEQITAWNESTVCR